MLNIAICDDVNQEILTIRKKLQTYQQTHSDFTYIEHIYHSGEELVSAYEAGTTFDIIYLDIYMTGINGVEVAKHLRHTGYKGQLAFLTSSEAHALEAYQVDATSYLLKPVTQEVLSDSMDKLRILIQAALPRVILLRSSGEDYSIALDTITYTETNGHYQEVHLANGDMLPVRSTVTSLFENLNLPCFMLVGRSYILNFNFVRKISPSGITMNDGSNLFPPRGSLHKIREQYFKFYQTI